MASISLPAGHRALDVVEEADELLVPMLLHAAADHRAVEHVECGEQRRRAVALVVVGHRAAAARLDRQSRLRAVERLDLALLVDRQHHGMRRRVQIEADDVGQLGDEVGIARALEGARRGAAGACAPPRCAAPSATKCRRRWAIARPVQCVASCGGSPQVSATTRATVSAEIGGLPGLRVLSRSSPSAPSSAKRCCQRQTIGRLIPRRVAIGCTGPRSAAASTTRARSTCFCGRLRSATIASSICLSDELRITHTVCAMPTNRTLHSCCESAEWVRALARKPKKLAAVALANKIARIYPGR